MSEEASFIDTYKRALRDDRSLAERYPKRGEAANVKLLLCMLLLRYPRICPSGPTIMADCGWTDERTLTKAKKDAVQAGWLVIRHRGRGPGDPTVYELELPPSNVGTSNAGTSNASQLPPFNADNHPHSMGDKDPKEDPKEDASAASARAGGASPGAVVGKDLGGGARPGSSRLRYEELLSLARAAGSDFSEVASLGGYGSKIRYLEKLLAARQESGSKAAA